MPTAEQHRTHCRTRHSLERGPGVRNCGRKKTPVFLRPVNQSQLGYVQRTTPAPRRHLIERHVTSLLTCSEYRCVALLNDVSSCQQQYKTDDREGWLDEMAKVAIRVLVIMPGTKKPRKLEKRLASINILINILKYKVIVYTVYILKVWWCFRFQFYRLMT